MDYKNFTKYRVNTEVTDDYTIPEINGEFKNLLGLHTGEWITFPNSGQHFTEKEKRRGEGEEWLEIEFRELENPSGNDYRYIQLRNGGSYDLVLYLLAHKYKFLDKFWDVGIALISNEWGAKVGEYVFNTFPTIGDLFLISLMTPELFPNLEIEKNNSCPKRYIETLLNAKISSIITGDGIPSKYKNKINGWHESKLKRSKVIEEKGCGSYKRFCCRTKHIYDWYYVHGY